MMFAIFILKDLVEEFVKRVSGREDQKVCNYKNVGFTPGDQASQWLPIIPD